METADQQQQQQPQQQRNAVELDTQLVEQLLGCNCLQIQQ
jgi:hypothetical protein